jgi:hypothetical protein
MLNSPFDNYGKSVEREREREREIDRERERERRENRLKNIKIKHKTTHCLFLLVVS